VPLLGSGKADRRAVAATVIARVAG
jgi:hypothetical protein